MIQRSRQSSIFAKNFPSAVTNSTGVQRNIGDNGRVGRKRRGPDMRVEQIQQLLIEVGEQLDLDQITESTEQHSWYLITKEGVLVDVDFDESIGRLYLSTS